jgi:hypothetical protein
MKDKNQIRYPYARLTGVTQFMTFVREPDWDPGVINANVLKTLKIAKGKEREAIQALKFLGIVAEDGTPTEQFDNLRQDYTGTMKKLVMEKYKDVFKLIPANLIDLPRLVNFFGLSPDTSEYQAKLFGWFCEQAGIDLPKLDKHFHRSRFDKKNGK